MASTECGKDQKTVSLQEAQSELTSLFGAGSKDVFSTIKEKAADVTEKINEKLTETEEAPNLQKELQKLNGASPSSAISTIGDIQTKFGGLVSDLNDILNNVSPSLAEIATDFKELNEQDEGALAELQASTTGVIPDALSSLAGRTAEITNISAEVICAEAKNLEIQTLEDGTEKVAEVPPEPKVPEEVPTVETPVPTMTNSPQAAAAADDTLGQGNFFGSLGDDVEPADKDERDDTAASVDYLAAASRQRKYNDTEYRMKIIENKLFKDIKRALINPFGKEPIVDKRFGTFDKKTYRAIDVSLDPFDPENAEDLRGLTPQEYKNGQDLKISDRKKYKALNRQWYIDLYEIYNDNAAVAGEELIPQSEIDQIGDSFITEDEIAEYPEVVFKADSGALSIHAVRDLMKERWEDFTTKEDPGGLLYGFFFFWYLRVKLDRTGTVD